MMRRWHPDLRRGDGGFVLVELLVVVLVLGILASIGITVFLHQRDKAWDAAVVSDLRGAVTAQHTYMTGATPAEFASDLPGLVSAGFTPSSGSAHHDRVFGMTVSSVGAERFCMTARSGSGRHFGFSSDLGLVVADSPLDPASCS